MGHVPTQVRNAVPPQARDTFPPKFVIDCGKRKLLLSAHTIPLPENTLILRKIQNTTDHVDVRPFVPIIFRHVMSVRFGFSAKAQAINNQ